MKTDIQDTELYQNFKKALNINDMRADDNPYIVKCINIALKYAEQYLNKIPDSTEIYLKAKENDEKDFDRWWWETVYKK